MQKCRIGEHIKSSAPKENGTDGSLALYSPFSACTGGAKSGLSTFTENKTDCTLSLSYYILDNLSHSHSSVRTACECECECECEFLANTFSIYEYAICIVSDCLHFSLNCWPLLLSSFIPPRLYALPPPCLSAYSRKLFNLRHCCQASGSLLHINYCRHELGTSTVNQGLDRDTGNDFEAMSQLPHRSYEGLDRDTGMTLKPCQGRAQVE